MRLIIPTTFEEVIAREHAAGVIAGPFRRAWLLDRAPDGTRRLLARATERPGIVCARQGFASADIADFPPANLRAAIANTTTETMLWDPGIWGAIPVGDMRAGKVYRVEFGGVMGTTGTPTIAWRARFGTNNGAPPTGTDLGISPTVTLGTFTAQPFYGEFQVGVRSVGVAAAGATVTGNGYVVMPAAAAATVTPHAVFGGAVPATVDHTIAQGIGVSIAWGTASASNTLTPQWVILRSLN